MDFPCPLDLTDHLDALTDALDGSGDDLNTILHLLVEDLTAAVASFVGLSVTISAQGDPVTVTAMTSHTAAASMMLPLSLVAGNPDESYLVLYARNAGAFVDLAADARLVAGNAGDIVVDGHLPPPTAFAAKASLDALTERSTLDQAIGFLIEQGYAPQSARTELRRRAAAAGVSIAAAARTVLNT